MSGHWLALYARVALDRQPNADYHARRVALSQKMNDGVAMLFAGTEAEGPNAVYGFRQDNNFFYLSGWAEPGAAVMISPQVKVTTHPGRPYSEILFLPVHNLAQEKWTGPKLGADNPQGCSDHRLRPGGEPRPDAGRVGQDLGERLCADLCRPGEDGESICLCQFHRVAEANQYISVAHFACTM